jgi:hypothetical protein
LNASKAVRDHGIEFALVIELDEQRLRDAIRDQDDDKENNRGSQRFAQRFVSILALRQRDRRKSIM